MSSIKAVIKKKPYSNGEYPIFIYYNDRHLSFPQHKSIGITVPKEYFQKKSFEHVSKKIDSKSPGLSAIYNNHINEVLGKIKKASFDIKATNNSPSLEDLFVFAGILQQDEITFEQFANEYVSKRKVSTRKTYSQYLKSIIPALGNTFKFKDFTEKTIPMLQSKLEQQGLTNNSINMYVSLVRCICVAASKTPHPENPKLAIFDFKEHYFNKLKAKPLSKGAISVEDLLTLINHPLKQFERMDISRDVFIFQFFCQGNRVSDVLRLLKDEVKNNSISIVELKTQKDKRSPVQAILRKIIEKYKHYEGPYVFPLLKTDKRLTANNEALETKLYQEQASILGRINIDLQRIAKLAGIRADITTHVARHTFASLADKKLGGDLRVLQAIMNHHSRDTTENYIHNLRESNYEAETLKVYEDFTFNNN